MPVVKRLTDRMCEILRNADLNKATITNVPLGTMYGLDARGLIPRTWRQGHGNVRVSNFPSFDNVELTAAGIRVAWMLKGKPDTTSEQVARAVQSAADDMGGPIGATWIRPRPSQRGSR